MSISNESSIADAGNLKLVAQDVIDASLSLEPLTVPTTVEPTAAFSSATLNTRLGTFEPNAGKGVFNGARWRRKCSDYRRTPTSRRPSFISVPSPSHVSPLSHAGIRQTLVATGV